MKKASGQTKKHSLIEACCNVGSGMIIAFGVSQLAHHYQEFIQLHIWKDFIWELSWKSNAIMTTILTVVSVLRGFIWRRVFNRIQVRSYRK